jgi:hypothetical protein
MTGTQRIGYDPLTGHLRAWIFDSAGGYADGYFHRDGDAWILKTSGVTADGRMASGRQIFGRIDDHRLSWQPVDYVIGSEQLPDMSAVTIVRKPPAPSAAKPEWHRRGGLLAAFSISIRQISGRESCKPIRFLAHITAVAVCCINPGAGSPAERDRRFHEQAAAVVEGWWRWGAAVEGGNIIKKNGDRLEHDRLDRLDRRRE